jgi:homoserine kinase
MDTILHEATNHGALGVALSGAGPSMLALVDTTSPEKAQLERFLHETFRDAGVEADTMWLKPASKGAEILTLGPESSTLFQNVKGEVRT